MRVVAPLVGLGLVVAVLVVWQTRSLAVARARASDGVWRVRVLEGAQELLVATPRALRAGGSPALDLEPTPAGLVCTPSRWSTMVGFAGRTLTWDAIVSVREQEIGRGHPGTVPSLAPQTAVVIAVVDELLFDDGVPPTADEMREAVDGFTDALGGAIPPGTDTITVATVAAEGLADAIRLRATGAQRLGLTGGS